MPILGKRIYTHCKSLKDIGPNDTIYTIPHTKEQLKSKADYEKKLALYNDRIWTCRCTGHTGLTHEEAWRSEKSVHKMLRTQFPQCYEKTVLELVHHSTIPLDVIIDQAWLKLQQCLTLGEEVALNVKTTGKSISGYVVKLDNDGVNANPTSNCSSPSSSDKENAGDGDKNGTPRKWIPPKLLPYKYSIKLKDEDKVISLIPAVDLMRITKTPSKDLLRLFIRSNGIRVGPNGIGPWVIEEAVVKKYSLPSKFADFFLSPKKMAEMAHKAEEEALLKRKRKTNSKHSSTANKKMKLENNKTKSIKCKNNNHKVNSKSPSKTKQGTPVKSPHNSNLKGVVCIELDSDSNDESDSCIDSANSDDDVVLMDVKNAADKKAVVKLSKLSPSKVKQRTVHVGAVKTKLERSPTKAGGSTKSGSKLQGKKSSDVRSKEIKTKTKHADKKKASEESTPKKDRKNVLLKKGMKQMTLFDLKKGGDSKNSNERKKSPAKKTAAIPPPQPALVTSMLKIRNDPEKVKLFNALVRRSAKELSTQQRARLPAEVKDTVIEKYTQLQEFNKIKMMTPAKRATYLAEKREKQKKEGEAKRKERRAKERELRKQRDKRFEDKNLTLKPLPQPKLVPTPEGMLNESFGDVTLVTEFISCYAGLLMPEDKAPIYTSALMSCLTAGHKGFNYLSRMLTVLLQTLLQDEIAEDYRELGMPVTELPVNEYTASELVRLCLRTRDDVPLKDDASEISLDSENIDEDEVPSELIQLLDSQELYHLEPEQKLQILNGLCLRVMSTYSLQDYMEKKQNEATKLWMQKIDRLKQKNTLVKQEKAKKIEAQLKEDERRQEQEQQQQQEQQVEQNNQGPKCGLTLDHFYGNQSKESTPEDNAPTPVPNSPDMATIVKRRRELSAKALVEKEKKDQLDRVQREKEYGEVRKLREWEHFEKTFEDGMNLAKVTLRHVPVGTDRNHSRYWIFSNTTPGLFVEKGWANSDIEYSLRDGESSDSDQSDDQSHNDSDEADQKSKQMLVDERLKAEKTFPHVGQNLWFMYDEVSEFNALLESLHIQGIRESMLKRDLEKRYKEVTKAIDLIQKPLPVEEEDDGDEEMVEGFKKEVVDLELKIRNGGLGGVNNFDKWDQKVTDADTLSKLGLLTIEMQDNVYEKFLQGIMGKKKPKKKQADLYVKDAEDDEEKEEIPEPPGIQIWKDAVKSCPTFSRLHVLLGMLEACIKWEKSAENAKCKICRKKGDDSKVLLCDDCNMAFHMYCLRPALARVPPGEWFCPACIPESRRRSRACTRPGVYDTDSDADSDGNALIQHNETCSVCDGDEGLVYCSDCPNAFHTECHDPPLRHPPRGQWICCECKTGVRLKSRKRGPAKRQTKQRAVRATSRRTLKEESEEEDRSSSEEEEAPPPKKRGRPPSRRRLKVESDDDDDENEESPPPSRRGRRRKKVQEESEEEDDDEEEEDDEEDASPPPKKIGRPSKTKKAPSKRSSTGSSRGSRASKHSEVSSNEGYKKASKRAPSDLSICDDILTRLQRHDDSWPFLESVSKKDVPDYYDIIKKPMDLERVYDKLNQFHYPTPDQFIADVTLIFHNCAQYNKVDTPIYDCMESMEKYFASLLLKYLPDYACNADISPEGYKGSRRSRH